MKYRKAYIQALIEVMSMDDAAEGIHIDMIADRLCVCGITGVSGNPRDEIRDVSNRIILSDCRRSGGIFAKVKDHKSGRCRRGVYKLVEYDRYRRETEDDI